MRTVEEMLREKGKELEQLKAPDDMEQRLRNRLEGYRPKSRRKTARKVMTAAVLIICLFIGYNLKTLAFYAKQLTGYDTVMNGTLKQLNELGKGQIISEKYTMANGVTVSLDGAMLDENQLILFYTLKNPGGGIDKVELGPVCDVKGIFGSYYMKSAYGSMNEDKTEISYEAEFDVPHLFDNSLTFDFTVTGDKKSEAGKIKFKLDRSKAMGHTLKESINRTVVLDSGEIYFDSILATPTRTTIKGSLRSPLGLAYDEIAGERFRPGGIGVELLANGASVESQGSGMSTDMKGITFHHDFDALPKDLKRLQLHITSYTADHDVNGQISLRKGSGRQSLSLLSQTVDIDQVYEAKGETCVTITTEDSTRLTRVNLTVDGKSVKLKNTDSDKYEKNPDGKIFHTRTLHFPAVGSSLELNIRRMTFTEACDKTIDIPVE